MTGAETAPTLSRRERKKERTRSEIYDAAMRLFREQGFDAVTITEICEAADVGRGTFFLHFPTKAALLYQFNDRFADAFRAEMQARPRASARLELEALDERMSVELLAHAEVMGAMLSEFFNTPQSLAPAAARQDALAALVTEIIAGGQARGEFTRRVDARLAAASFFGTAAAILSGVVFREGEISTEEVNRQFLQLTLSGLSPAGDADPS